MEAYIIGATMLGFYDLYYSIGLTLLLACANSRCSHTDLERQSSCTSEAYSLNSSCSCSKVIFRVTRSLWTERERHYTRCVVWCEMFWFV